MPAFPTVQPQPQAAPLNNEGQQSIASLLHHDTARKRLQSRHKKAALILQNVAGDVNDRAYEARTRHEKKLRRLEADEEEEPEDELDEYKQYQNQVKDVTDRLEYGVRSIIDDIDWLASVPDTLKIVAMKAGVVAEETQRTPSTIPMTTQRSRRILDDEEEDAEMLEDNQQPIATQLDPSNAPTALLQTGFERQMSAWNAMSLTDKYAKSNEYKGFYKTVFDSKHPGDDNLVPDENMWFAAEEGRQAETAVVPALGSDDDDLHIDHVVIRMICPVTMKPFEDPVTSRKCPHSFERSAFNEIFKRSAKPLPFTEQQVEELDRCSTRAERIRKEKEIAVLAVECPECKKVLTEEDVVPDPVLQRKVHRMVAEKQNEREADEDSEDEDDEVPRGTQRKPVGLGSSPPSRRASGRVHEIKGESGRVAWSLITPSTQTTTAEGATVVDLGDEDDDEDMEEEDEEEE